MNLEQILKNEKYLVLFLILVVLVLIFIFPGPQLKTESIERYCREGKSYLEIGDYEKAEEAFAKVLETDFYCPIAYFGMGKAALIEDDYDEAEQYFKKSFIFKHEPFSKSSMYLELSQTYLLKGDCKNSIGYASLALDKANQEIEDPELKKIIEADVYVAEGSVSMCLGDTNEALDYFNKALAIEITDEITSTLTAIKTYGGLGTYYLALTDYQKAKESFEIILSTETASPLKQLAYLGLGRAYFGLKNFQEAVNSLQIALQFLENSDLQMPAKSLYLLETHQQLGRSYFALLDYAKAEEEFKKALEESKSIKNNPDYEPFFAAASASLGLGRIVLAQGGFATAEQYFESGLNSLEDSKPEYFYEILNNNFLNIIFHYELAETYFSQDGLEKAKDEINKAQNLIQALSQQDYSAIEKNQWFEDGQSVFQKVSSLKNKLD